MIYDITDNNLHIYNSYRVVSSNMYKILLKIRRYNPESDVWLRSLYSLKNEWIVHNTLYKMNICRDRTKDVDLNYPNRYEWLYNMLAPVCRFILFWFAQFENK